MVLEWSATKSGTGGTLVERASRRLTSDGALVTKWAPMMLEKELDAYLWCGEEHVSVKLIREDLAKYLYLPRLRDGSVLEETIRDGVASGEFFGYAQSVGAGGRYEGLKFGDVGVIVYMDESSVLVRPYAARRRIREATAGPVAGEGEEALVGGVENGATGGGSPIGGGTVAPPIPPKSIEDLSTSFYGIVEIDPARLGGSAGAISQEVVQRLSSILGANVRVTLEIKADVPNGIPEKVERDVSENCSTLRFRECDFRE